MFFRCWIFRCLLGLSRRVTYGVVVSLFHISQQKSSLYIVLPIHNKVTLYRAHHYKRPCKCILFRAAFMVFLDWGEGVFRPHPCGKLKHIRVRAINLRGPIARPNCPPSWIFHVLKGAKIESKFMKSKEKY